MSAPGQPVDPRRISPMAMLFILASGFAVSQAFRTVASIFSVPLSQDLGMNARMLGSWSAAFHLTFGLTQFFMGVALDLHGPRRTVLCAGPVAVLGAVVCAMAPSYEWLLIGQVLIGLGCAPAFLACMVFISREFESARFTALSGLCMSFSSIGILYTGTPLAYLVEHGSWRLGYVSLAVLAGLATTLIAIFVHPKPAPVSSSAAAGAAADPGAADGAAPRPSFLRAVLELIPLLRMPHTAGLLCFSLVSYAAMMTLRGLWLGPLLQERHGLSLINAGNVAVAMTIGGMMGPALFGRFDPGGLRRTRGMALLGLGAAGLLAVMAFTHSVWVDVGGAVFYGLLSGYGIWQFAYVRSAYPPALTGRAIALANSVMFLGIALMQWLTGVVSTWAGSHDVEAFKAVLLTMSAMLAAGAIAFTVLPQRHPTPR